MIELYTFMIDNSVDVACISETCLSSLDVVYKHRDFYVHRLDRPEDETERRAGGVAMIIRKTVAHTPLSVPPTHLIEAMGVEIRLTNGSLVKIYSIYVPGGVSNADIRQSLKSDLQILKRHAGRNFYLCGDFNAKHRLWNCNRANRAGLILHEFSLSQRVLIIHPDEPTYFSPAANRLPSTIDLAITDASYSCTDPETHPSDSDHAMVTFEVLLESSFFTEPNHTIPCFRKTDWKKYKETVTRVLNGHPMISLNELDNPR